MVIDFLEVFFRICDGCGGDERFSWSSSVSCLRWAYLHFSSQWNLCGASIPFSKAFRNCDFSPLRRRCSVASFGFGCSQRLLAVSAACLISPRSNCVVGFALWFRVEFSCRRRMEVFF
ncbi:hypothetical protein QL285_068740 [Trifolium repens]|nr:hypothetical protein QL285_068740 [Trifolium repens]